MGDGLSALVCLPHLVTQPVASRQDPPINIPLRELLRRVNRGIDADVLSEAGPKKTAEVD